MPEALAEADAEAGALADPDAEPLADADPLAEPEPLADADPLAEPDPLADAETDSEPELSSRTSAPSSSLLQLAMIVANAMAAIAPALKAKRCRRLWSQKRFIRFLSFCSQQDYPRKDYPSKDYPCGYPCLSIFISYA